jgi:hypothetical protein
MEKIHHTEYLKVRDRNSSEMVKPDGLLEVNALLITDMTQQLKILVSDWPQLIEASQKLQ